MGHHEAITQKTCLSLKHIKKKKKSGSYAEKTAFFFQRFFFFLNPVSQI